MFAPRSIKHCRACGGEVRYQTPADDNRDRATCLVCTTIHYENPLNVVGTLPVWQDQVLLCRRAIEPRHGLWTLPAGFMELGETTADGALRETVEEAGAKVELEGLYSLINVVRVGQVHLFYRARMLDIDFVPRLVAGRTLPGRGAYTCRRLQCYERAPSRRAFNRILRRTVRVDPEIHVSQHWK